MSVITERVEAGLVLPDVKIDKTLYFIKSQSIGLLDIYVSQLNNSTGIVEIFQIARNSSVILVRSVAKDVFYIIIKGLFDNVLKEEVIEINADPNDETTQLLNNLNITENNGIHFCYDIDTRNSKTFNQNQYALVLDASADSNTTQPVAIYRYNTDWVFIDELPTVELTIGWFLNSNPISSSLTLTPLSLDLPETLAPNTVYFVKSGISVAMYITDFSANILYSMLGQSEQNALISVPEAEEGSSNAIRGWSSSRVKSAVLANLKVFNEKPLVRLIPENNSITLNMNRNDYYINVNSDLDINLALPTSPTRGYVEVSLFIDNTGGYNITLPENLYTSDGLIPFIDTSPNSINILFFWTDGLDHVNLNVDTRKVVV